MKRLLAVSVTAFALGAFTGCGGEGDDEVIDEVTNTVDCAEICNTYSDCVTDIDVTSCTDECEDFADQSEANEADADACEECVSDRSCQEIEDAACFDNCPVVPVSD